METRDRTDAGAEPRRPERKKYHRPELVKYGALEEITRGYYDTKSCSGSTYCGAG